ncbi:MAG: efflux RND transporter permease subunit [Anaerolineae bacterium]|jgi:HAE1 family hydrophobic/amphiphilic exporter-1
MIQAFIDRLTRASLRFKWVTIVLAIIALVAGVIAVVQLNQELIPSIEFPTTIVLAFNSGMEPEDMRDEVTIPIEDAVKDIEGVMNVESTTSTGVAVIQVQSEFGLDMDAFRAEIADAVGTLSYPEGMETPELLTFGMDDLPAVYGSVSSEELSLAELKALVEAEILPVLDEIPGVAAVQVSGGQELPTEPPPTPEPTPTQEPTATPTLEPSPTPTTEPTAAPTEVPPTPTPDAAESVEPEPIELPESWVQAAAAQGVTLATTADLTPQMVAAIAGYAPQMLGELTPEMLLAMPLDALAALPEEYLQSLDPELQAQLAERAAAAEAEQEEANQAGPAPLPESWTAGAAAWGVKLETTDDLTPLIMRNILSRTPEALAEITPEMLFALPLDVLEVLPEEYIESLDPQLQAKVAARLAGEEVTGAAPEPTHDPALLPDVWQAAGQSQGITLVMPEDVTPEIIQGIAGMAPQLLNLLTPENLRRFAPEVLGWLPAEYIEGLDPELRAKLDELAAPVGGLGALAAAAQAGQQVQAEGAPELGGLWRAAAGTPGMPTFETAADLMTSGFTDSAAELLNLLVENLPQQAPQLIADLTPDVIAWLIENEEGFLEKLSPATLRLMSPEVLASLPAGFYDALDPDLRAELEAIAAGTAEAFVPTNTITCVNGNPSLRLIVYKDGEANTVTVTHAVYDQMDTLEEAYPGLRFDITFEQASFIEESISGVTREGALGALFAVIVILLFLSGTVRGRYHLSWRSTLVTAASIPLSVFMAFALLYWLPPVANLALEPLASATKDIPVLGAIIMLIHRMFPTEYTLNIMTLSGMTVAIGRVVDDSIVVLENIYRHIQRGDDRKQAVIQGTKDVSIAILASTVTTVIVFMPIGLVGGIVGEFFLPFGITVAYALGSSFLVAVTIVPVLAYLFIRKEHLPEEKETTLQRWYTPVLEWALKHRAIVLAIAGVLFVGSMFLLSRQPQALLPDMGEPQITVDADLPNGTTMSETAALVAEFETEVADVEGLGTRQCEIGAAGGMMAMAAQMFGGGGIDQSLAGMDIGIEELDRVDELTAIVREKAEQVFGADYVTVSGGGLMSSAFASFSLVVSGEPSQLAAINDQVIATLEQMEGLANVTSNAADETVILRVGGEPALRYTGEVETADSMGLAAAARAEVEAVVPPEVTVSEGFESEMQTRSFAQAIEALLISIIVVYVVLVVTFRSFVHPFTILLSLPLALIGAALLLWITDRVVGLPVLVGMMMLVGIVVTNAIVLIDRVQNNRKLRGMDVKGALMEGGRTRLRPILMTAVATILALTPLAIGLTEGALIAAELATVVIGGLFSSTLLTLLVVPVMYSLLDRLTRTGRQEAREAAPPAEE